jgi:hypothetical protein
MVLLCLILYFSQKIENSPRAIYEKNWRIKFPHQT